MYDGQRVLRDIEFCLTRPFTILLFFGWPWLKGIKTAVGLEWSKMMVCALRCGGLPKYNKVHTHLYEAGRHCHSHLSRVYDL